MKNWVSVFIGLIVIFSCESTPKKSSLKMLDWNKTADEQKMKIGDVIIVEGLAYNIVEYFYTSRSIFYNYDNTNPPSSIVHVPAAIRNRWSEKISIPLYNPEQPNVEEDPNIPVGSVVCTIFNPNYEEDLKALHEMYPYAINQETPKEAFRSGRYKAKYESQWTTEFKGRKILPHIQHTFRFTGSIRGFTRKTLRGVSLRCIDLVVSDIDVISSKTLKELEDWRTEKKMGADEVIEIGNEIIVK